MKNQLILMAAAALAFASCSKDEMTEVNPGNAIGFRTAVTRAVEANLDALKADPNTAGGGFKVTAIDDVESHTNNYFTGLLVSWNGSDAGSWVTAQQYFWPGTGSLTFYAWYPSSLAPTITRSSKTFDFTPDASFANQKDFMTSTVIADKTSGASGVALNFEHRLSEIFIKAKNTNTSYTYKVAGVRIARVAGTGTFDFAGSSWSSTSAPATYTATYDDHTVSLSSTSVSIMDGTNQSTNGAAMLIPQDLTAWNCQGTGDNNGSYIAVKVQILTADGAQVFPKETSGYGWVAVPIDTNWTPGMRYTYVLDFSNGAGKVPPTDPDTDRNPGDDVLGGAIQFNVTVSGWTDGNGSNGQDLPMTSEDGVPSNI